MVDPRDGDLTDAAISEFMDLIRLMVLQGPKAVHSAQDDSVGTLWQLFRCLRCSEGLGLIRVAMGNSVGEG